MAWVRGYIPSIVSEREGREGREREEGGEEGREREEGGEEGREREEGSEEGREREEGGKEGRESTECTGRQRRPTTFELYVCPSLKRTT